MQHTKSVLKKLFFMVFVSLLCFSGQSYSEAADKSGWQLVDTTYIGSGTRGVLKGVEGGNAKICLKDAFGGANVSFYSYNGSAGRKLIDYSVSMGNNSCYSFDARPYLDGANNEAEFEVENTRHILGTIKFELWD